VYVVKASGQKMDARPMEKIYPSCRYPEFVFESGGVSLGRFKSEPEDLNSFVLMAA
jgi:hypothetical protein